MLHLLGSGLGVTFIAVCCHKDVESRNCEIMSKDSVRPSTLIDYLKCFVDCLPCISVSLVLFCTGKAYLVRKVLNMNFQLIEILLRSKF